MSINILVYLAVFFNNVVVIYAEFLGTTRKANFGL